MHMRYDFIPLFIHSFIIITIFLFFVLVTKYYNKINRFTKLISFYIRVCLKKNSTKENMQRI